MTTKILNTTDSHLEALKGKRVAVIGYGSQGRAHALNMRDTGIDVVLGLREGGKSWQQAVADGWSPLSVEDASKGADLIALLLPDMHQPKLFHSQVAPHMKPNAAILFAHGFNILYGSIKVDSGHDVIMCAPKGPGAIVRREYVNGAGVPCLVATAADASGKAYELSLAYAHAIGCGRAGVLQTTFKEETETDLFGEQVVLCGGLTELIKAGWETLVAAGYSPEVAYFECLHETKLIVDLIYEGGLARMHQFISDTAKYGCLVSGPRVVTEESRAVMKTLLGEIQDGSFAAQWQKEFADGETNYRKMLAGELKHDIEGVGRNVRKHFSWLDNSSNETNSKTHSKPTATQKQGAMA